MRLFGLIKKKEEFRPGPDMLHLIDRLHLALGEEFNEGLIGKKQSGYVSKSKTVGVLPEGVFPPYKPKLKEIKKEELIICERFIGLLGGTMVEHALFEKTTGALEKDRTEYRILINKNIEMPLIICTKYANIIIAPVMRRYE